MRWFNSEHIDKAREILIQRQDTHLDSLAERLRENRVRAIIEPILADQTLGDIPNDDRLWVRDLQQNKTPVQEGAMPQCRAFLNWGFNYIAALQVAGALV